MATLVTRCIGDLRGEDFFAGLRADDFFAAFLGADFLAGALFALRFALFFFALFFAPPLRAVGRDLPAFLPAFFLAAMRNGSCR